MMTDTYYRMVRVYTKFQPDPLSIRIGSSTYSNKVRRRQGKLVVTSSDGGSLTVNDADVTAIIVSNLQKEQSWDGEV